MYYGTTECVHLVGETGHVMIYVWKEFEFELIFSVERFICIGFVHLEIALDIWVQTCVKASLCSILEVISEGNWIV